MGSSAFEAASFSVAMDDACGMGFSAVHKVRAAACEALEHAILSARADRIASLPSRARIRAEALTADVPQPDDAGSRTSATPAQLCVATANLAAAELARELGADIVYMGTDALEAEGLSPADATSRGIVPILDEVCREGDRDRLDRWIIPEATVAVANISELALAATIGAQAELRSCIPVHNRACATMLAKKGARLAWLSPELTLAEIERFCPSSPLEFGIEMFGRPRVMTSEHCILQVADACIHDCARCGLRKRRLWLRNIDGRMLPVTTDIHGRSHLYDGAAIDITPQIPQLLAAGVSRFMVDGALMDDDELKRAVAHARRALDAALAGRAPAKRLQGTTAGCLFVGVE